jgi:hypothetical protein
VRGVPAGSAAAEHAGHQQPDDDDERDAAEDDERQIDIFSCLARAYIFRVAEDVSLAMCSAL